MKKLSSLKEIFDTRLISKIKNLTFFAPNEITLQRKGPYNVGSEWKINQKGKEWERFKINKSKVH